jgi:hypothetical protein
LTAALGLALAACGESDEGPDAEAPPTVEDEAAETEPGEGTVEAMVQCLEDAGVGEVDATSATTLGDLQVTVTSDGGVATIHVFGSESEAEDARGAVEDFYSQDVEIVGNVAVVYLPPSLGRRSTSTRPRSKPACSGSPRPRG